MTYYKGGKEDSKSAFSYNLIRFESSVLFIAILRKDLSKIFPVHIGPAILLSEEQRLQDKTGSSEITRF